MSLSILTALTLGAARLVAQQRSRSADPGPPRTEVFYASGSLQIQAYLYKPEGEGPFPLIVYNHGSREGQERSQHPQVFVGRLLTAAGYAVLVPERRGYGKSAGPGFREEVGRDLGAKLVRRLEAEADDVLAALVYVQSLPHVDKSRMGIMGWSLGGVVSLFAAARSDAFRAVVDQAGGALTWTRSRALQTALPAAGRIIKAPVLCMDAENDATTEAVKSVCDAARSKGVPAETVIYPAFEPSRKPRQVAQGHELFSRQGASVWGKDVVGFFDKHLSPKK